MTRDLDLTNREHLDWDEGVVRYEADRDEFFANTVDALTLHHDWATLPQPLRQALLDWYRTTDQYRKSVRYVIDEAAKP